MQKILLKLHSFEKTENFFDFFKEALKDLFKINKFTVVYYNDQDFSYKVVISSFFKKDDFFFDTEIKDTYPFELHYENKVVKVFNVFEFKTEDNIIFKFLIHEDVILNEDFEDFFKHFVVAYKKLTILKYYQNSVVSSKLQLDLLNQIGEIIGSLDLDVVLTKILEGAVNIVDGDVGAIFLKEEEDFIEKISWGVPKGVIEKFINKISGKNIIEEVFENKEVVLIEDVEKNTTYEFFLKDRYLIKSIIGLPLYTKNKNLGVLILVNIEIDMDFIDIKLSTLETLTQIASVGIENAIFFKDSIEKEKLKHQIKVASELQKNFFPKKDIITDKFYIGGFSVPAMNVGGDFYNYIISEDKNKLIGFVGDVAGKGVPAALLTSMAMILIKTLISFDKDLEKVIEKINNIIVLENLGEKYFTLGIFIVDFKELKVELVNAGHSEILLYSNKNKEILSFPPNNLPIGMFEDISFEKYEISISNGDLLLNFSDGIPDAVNEKGERYELERLKKLIKQKYDIEPEKLKSLILNDVYSFCGKAQQFDDLTLLLLKVM